MAAAFFCDFFSVIKSFIHNLLSDRQQYLLCDDERSSNLSSTEFRFAGWNPETVEAYRFNISRFSNTATNSSDSYDSHASQSNETGRNRSSSLSKNSCFCYFQQHQPCYNLPRTRPRSPVSTKDTSSYPSTTSAAPAKETFHQTISGCSTYKLNSQSTQKEAAILLEKYDTSPPPTVVNQTPSPLKCASPYPLNPPMIPAKKSDYICTKKDESPFRAVDFLLNSKKYTETTRKTFHSPADLPKHNEKTYQNSEEFSSVSTNDSRTQLFKKPHIYPVSSHVSSVKVKSDHKWVKREEFTITTKDPPAFPLKSPPKSRKNTTNSLAGFPRQKVKTSCVWTPKGLSPSSSMDEDLPKLQMHSTLTKKKLYQLSSYSPTENSKTNYVSVVNEEASSIFEVPAYLKDQLERCILPKVLKGSITPETYIQYFTTLLHAEDFYVEKWSDFLLQGVTLELHKASIYRKKAKNKNMRINTSIDDEHDDCKMFVKFEVDSVQEKRPYLLSRDFVFLKPLSYPRAEPFRGVIYRVVHTTSVLCEFGPDFFARHDPAHTYDVSFSFNRVCLKRCQRALSSISPRFSRTFLFPEVPITPLIASEGSPGGVVFAGAWSPDRALPPQLVVGTVLSVGRTERPTPTGALVRAAVLKICRSGRGGRVLIVSHSNRKCDILMRSLVPELAEWEMFRANAAFREHADVPDDMLSMSVYEGECFTCPPLMDLRRFRVVSSTPISSTRLWSMGIRPGHFTHIFLVDACSMMEPEAVVPLAALAGEKTVVIVTGSRGTRPHWVRSDVGRRHGLSVSYFERLLGMSLCEGMDLDPTNCMSCVYV